MRDLRPVSREHSDWGLFSADELRGLMGIEFARAQRHAYDLACMCVATDRLEHLQDLYGAQAKARIQETLHEILRRATRDSDFPRAMLDDALLVLLPHTPPAGAAVLAQRLLGAALQAELELDGRPFTFTVSIGVSGNRDPGVSSVDAMSQRAQAGLALARAAGGAKWMRGELATDELDRLRRELDELRTALERQGEMLNEAQSVADLLARGSVPGGERALLDRPEDLELADRLAALFAEAGVLAGPDLARLQKALINMALRGVHEERQRDIERKLAGNEFELEMLRRRVSKLSSALAVTEEELRRVMALNDVDPGVESIYRTVQGLSLDAANAKARVDMLTRIFEHNLELRHGLHADGN